MICSPCRECENKHKPKDDCVDSCNRLREIRRIQFSSREFSICHAIDYADDDRFLIGYAENRRCA